MRLPDLRRGEAERYAGVQAQSLPLGQPLVIPAGNTEHEERRMMIAEVSEPMVAVILFAALAVVVLIAFLSRRK